MPTLAPSRINQARVELALALMNQAFPEAPEVPHYFEIVEHLVLARAALQFRARNYGRSTPPAMPGTLVETCPSGDWKLVLAELPAIVSSLREQLPALAERQLPDLFFPTANASSDAGTGQKGGQL